MSRLIRGDRLGRIVHEKGQASGKWVDVQALFLTGLAWVRGEIWLVVLALGVGVVAALLPAIQAYRSDIARTLARG